MRTGNCKIKSNQHGFSMVELAITLAIIGVLATVAVPMFKAGPDKRLKASSRNLWADVRYARMEAVKRRTDIGIHFWPTGTVAPPPFVNNSYVIFLDDGFNGGAAINPNDIGDGTLNALEGQGVGAAPNAPLRTIPMLQDVSLLSVNFPGGVQSIGYNSRALPTGVATGNIQLGSIPSPNRRYRLTFSQAGNVQIQSSEDSGIIWSDK